MKRTTFERMPCSVAQTLDIVGEWWTLLIVRDLFYGVSRFEPLREHLGISRRILADRLATLVEHGIVERVPYQQHPERVDYLLTDRGQDLFPVIVSLMNWGDTWRADGQPPVQLVDRDTGQPLQPVLVDAATGRPIRYQTTRATSGSPTHAQAWDDLQQARADSRSS